MSIGVLNMLRHVLFWSTAGGIIAAAGLMPTPSSEKWAELGLPQVSLSEINLSDLKLPEQPAFLADLGNLSVDMPAIAQSIEDQVVRVIPSLAGEAPELPTPLQPESPASLHKVATIAPNKQADVVNFDLNAVALDPQAQAKLRDFALWLQANPTAEIGIFGHTDLTGPDAYNEVLGQRRAEQVASYLAASGIEAERISIIMSYGERAPLVATDKTSRDNRRVQIETVQVN